MKSALPRPDFLRPASRPGWLAWAWCATGLLVLVVAAADGRAAWLARQQALDRLAVGQAPARLPAAAQGSATRAAAGRDPAQARADEARRWRDQLAQPWPIVWSASEAGADGVQWLVFDHGSGGLRLTGLAAGADAAEAAADALRLQRAAGHAAWQDVTLSAVERVPEGQRFELVARLAAGPGAAR